MPHQIISACNHFDEKILNEAYRMCLEFGKYWLQPINDRLGKKYPDLTIDELEAYNAICHTMRKEAVDHFFNHLSRLTKNQQKTSEASLLYELTTYMNEHYGGISKKNIKRTLHFGIYCAWKDGLDTCIR